MVPDYLILRKKFQQNIRLKARMRGLRMRGKVETEVKKGRQTSFFKYGKHLHTFIWEKKLKIEFWYGGVSILRTWKEVGSRVNCLTVNMRGTFFP